LFFARATLPQAIRCVIRQPCAQKQGSYAAASTFDLDAGGVRFVWLSAGAFAKRLIDLIISMLIISNMQEKLAPVALTPQREMAFKIMDVARLMKTFADQRARQYGMTRAQWAVLVRLDRSEGLKQSELAEMLDLQPITLTRLLDRLAQNGLIERRADPNDRRANRLFLMPAARPLLERLSELGTDMMETVLEGLDAKALERLLHDLERVRENLRGAINRNSLQPEAAHG
jgi:MarR family transcriptional regulator, transcriptional regulator for hemolysin